MENPRETALINEYRKLLLARRIIAAEMKRMRRTAGYTRTDHKHNPSFRQYTGLQEKLDTTSKSNAT
jgi:hypothetical protein